LRAAIFEQLGVRVKYRPAPLRATTPSAPVATPAASPAPTKSDDTPPALAANAAPVTEWAVASIPSAQPTLTSAPSTTPSSASDATPAGADAVAALPKTSDTPEVSETMPASGWHEPEASDIPFDDAPPPFDDEPPYSDQEQGYDTMSHSSSSQSAVPPADGARAEQPHVSSASSLSSASATRPAGSAQPSAAKPQSPAPRSAPGVQRYGEAVIRQVLDAKFVREEPYEAPTRFN